MSNFETKYLRLASGNHSTHLMMVCEIIYIMQSMFMIIYICGS